MDKAQGESLPGGQHRESKGLEAGRRLARLKESQSQRAGEE